MNFKLFLNYSQREKLPQGDQRKNKNKRRRPKKSLVASRQRGVLSPTGFSCPCIVTELTINFNHTMGRPVFFMCGLRLAVQNLGCPKNTKKKKMCCYYLPKVNTSAFALSFMRPKKVFYNYLRVLMSKFRLDGFKFS